STQEAFKQWIALARQRGEAGLAAERTILFGHWLVERQLWDEARGAYREAADIYRREKDVVGEARARNNLANLDVLAGSAQAAIASYRRTLRTLHDAEADTRTDMALAYFNLSLAHKQLGQQEEAIRALEEAMRLAVDLNDRQHQARIIAQRGTLRDDMGQWAEAMADYARATNLFDTLGDTLSKAVVRAHQALLYRRQGMYDRAAAILQESAAVFESADTPSPFDQAVLWLNLADLAFAMDNVDRAWELATQAQPIFEALKSHLASRTTALLAAMEDLPDDSH
ncbi:MAG: tetratricopeptide repeat protein, partial [Chloroflexi bacterium]|nr:tetratricopeptide repeat protein [Chloroflexota bacterium]